MKKSFFCLLIVLMAIVGDVRSQDPVGSAVEKPRYQTKYFQIGALGGMLFPVQELRESYKPSGNIGLNLGYVLNREVGFYANFNVNILTSSIPGGESSTFVEFITGPKYYFKSNKLKSKFFLDAGVGGFLFAKKTQTINPPTDNPFESSISVNFGASGGAGAEIYLATKVNLLLSSRYVSIFRQGGTSSYINVSGGLQLNLW
jgi:hypothetical protein